MTQNILNMTAISEALKDYYLPGLRYQLNEKASALLAQLEKDTESVVGKDIVMALRYGRVGGIGARDDDGDLPKPNSRKTKQAKWETKNVFARFQLSDKTIEASKSSVGAFASMLEQEIKDCETDAKLDLSRQVLGDGSGELCEVSAFSTRTLTVDTTMYLAEGMLIDVIDGNSPRTNCDGLEIESVDSDTEFTVVAVSGTPANGDKVCVQGSWNKELTGVAKVIDTGGTLYGIDRTDYPFLDAVVESSVGDITENGIQARIDEVEKGTGSETNFLLGSYGVRRAYANLLQATKSHVNTLDLKGGWKALSYTGGNQPIPFLGDRYVPEGLLYGLDLEDWKMYKMTDWDWMDRDGNMLTRVANKPAWEATLLIYSDIGCQRPRGQFVMKGINEL